MKNNKKKTAFILATVFAVSMMVGLVLVILRFKQLYDSGTAEITSFIFPIILILVGVVGVFIMTALSIAKLEKLRNSEGVFEISNKLYSIDPSLLKDERIQRLPEVKKLMEHESVRRAFSHGELPKNDPHVLELVEVLFNLADENGVLKL